MEKQRDLKGLLEYLVKNLVKNPEQVSINVVENKSAWVLELRVSPEDRGRVIGRQGKTVKAIRKLLSAANSGSERRAVLEILE